MLSLISISTWTMTCFSNVYQGLTYLISNSPTYFIIAEEMLYLENVLNTNSTFFKISLEQFMNVNMNFSSSKAPTK